MIYVKARGLLKYDNKDGQMARWYSLLRPVLQRFIRAFDAVNGNTASREERDYFWKRIVQLHSQGSGSNYISGWLTVFCFFNPDGQSLHAQRDDDEMVTYAQPVSS